MPSPLSFSARAIWERWRLPLAIFFTCMIVYLFFWSGHHYSIDGVVMFEYAKTLLFQHSFQMNPPLAWGTDMTVSKWPIGLTLLYMPILALLSVTAFRGNAEIRVIPHGSGVGYGLALMENRPYLFGSLVNPVITATTAVLVYFLGLQMGLSKRKACLAALIFGLISPAAVYTRFDYAQPLAGLLIAASVLCFLSARTRHSHKELILAGCFLGFGILTRPELALFVAAPMTILALFFSWDAAKGGWERVKTMLYFAVPLAAFVFLNQAINAMRFGGWLSVGYQPTSEFNFAPEHFLTAFLGNIISPGRGVFFFFPVAFFAILGVFSAWKKDRWSAALWTAILAGSFVFYATWDNWSAGLSWGPRFFIPILPIFSLLGVVGLNAALRRVRIVPWLIFAACCAFGGAATLQAMIFDFVGFYSSFHLTDAQFMLGWIYFRTAYSPLFQGWGYLTNLEHYDLFFLQRLEVVGYRVALGMIALGAILMTVFWARFFARKESVNFPAAVD